MINAKDDSPEVEPSIISGELTVAKNRSSEMYEICKSVPSEKGLAFYNGSSEMDNWKRSSKRSSNLTHMSGIDCHKS